MSQAATALPEPGATFTILPTSRTEESKSGEKSVELGKYVPKLSNALDTILDILIYRGIYFGKFVSDESRSSILQLRARVEDYTKTIESREDLFPVAEFEQQESDFVDFKEQIEEMNATKHDIAFEKTVWSLVKNMFGSEEYDFIPSFFIQYNQYKKVGILVRLATSSIGKNEVEGIVTMAKSLSWTHCILLSSEEMTPMAKRDLTMQLYKFPCEFFNIHEVQKNPLRHSLVPWYRILGPKTLRHFLQKHKCTIDEFPKMIESDKVTRILNLPKGCVVFEWPHSGFMYVPWTLRTVQATEKSDDGVVIF